MKLDMDLLRTILLKIEESPAFSKVNAPMQPVSALTLGIGGHDEDAVTYHCAQLVDGGYLTGNTKMAAHGMVMVGHMTLRGHEFLDAVRDPDIWSKTKQRTAGIATVGLGFLWEIAKSEIKLKLGLP